MDNGTAKHTIYLHNVQTKKLKPATVFQYQVGAADQHGHVTWNKATFEFHTARKGNTVNFIATADIGLVNAVAVPALKRLAASHKYDFLTLSGDQVCVTLPHFPVSKKGDLQMANQHAKW